MSFLSKTFSSLLVTRNKIRDTFSKVLNNSSIGADDLEIIEECLLSSDINWKITEKIVESIMSEPYSVPMCPPGWPNPPLIETE